MSSSCMKDVLLIITAERPDSSVSARSLILKISLSMSSAPATSATDLFYLRFAMSFLLLRATFTFRLGMPGREIARCIEYRS